LDAWAPAWGESLSRGWASELLVGPAGMHASAALFAIFVSALGCAHRDPSAPAWEARVVRPRQDAAPSEQRASARPKALSGPADAWFQREIAEREARIEALRQQLERADGREDEQAEDVKGRLERELELEEDSLRDFREQSNKRRSPGMIAGGLTLIGVGGALAFGTPLWLVLRGWSGGGSQEISDEQARVATVVLLSLSVSCFAVGLPVLVVGGRKRLVKPEATARVWVGPGEVSVRGSF
jgi:hypothetical protein